MFLVKVEPRYSEVSRDCQNLFAITSFRYIEVICHTFYYYRGKKNRSSYRGNNVHNQSLASAETEQGLALIMIQFQISQKPQNLSPIKLTACCGTRLRTG